MRANAVLEERGWSITFGGFERKEGRPSVKDVQIERVCRDNFHLFADLIYWRTHGNERTVEEQRISEEADYTDAYAQLDQENFVVYAALVGRRFVAWISLIYMPKVSRCHRGVVYVDELWTAPEFRRQGIAETLLEQAFAYKSETNAMTVRLYAGEDDVPAQNLYRKCGFAAIGNAVFMEADALAEDEAVDRVGP